MRYWILTTEFPPFFGGGISTYCWQTASMMVENGHDVTVFIYDYSVDNIHESNSGQIRVVRFRPSLTDANSFMGFAAALSYEYAEIIKIYIEKEGKPDVIESQDYNGIAYFLQQFKWQNIEPYANLKIIITCHSPSFICLEYNQAPVYQFPYYWIGEMEKASIKSADLIIFPSKYLQKEIEKRISIENSNYKIISNLFHETESQQSVLPVINENMVVCFGKLSPLKGSFELLAYFKKLWDQGSPLQLYFIGSTDYFFYPEGKTMYDLVVKKYKTYIDNKQLILTGNLAQQDSYSYLQKAKLVIVPSLFDNLPYTVLEAMSLGKIVLASIQGGQNEVIQHAQNGFIFDHKKENDFFDQLKKILDLKTEQYYLIGENAASTIRGKYSPSVIYLEKIAAIENLLQHHSDKIEYPFIHHSGSTENYFKNENINQEINLSVVVPYYNMGNYIEDCLDSVFKSIYKPFEVIIINDGSIDKLSIDKLEEVQKKYPVQIITRTNYGLSATRNYGAAIAKGRFIAFIDADDKVEKTYYQKAVEILKKYNNVHFVGCWLTYFGKSTGTWPTFNPEPPYIMVHNTINSSSLVFERKTFLDHGSNSTDMIYGMEDWETVIHLTKQGFRGVAIPQKLFHYRVRIGSMAQSFTREKQLYLYKLIGEKHKDFYSDFSSEIAQILNANGPGIYFDNPTFEMNGQGRFKKFAKYKNKIKQYIQRNKKIKKIAYLIYKKIK